MLISGMLTTETLPQVKLFKCGSSDRDNGEVGYRPTSAPERNLFWKFTKFYHLISKQVFIAPSKLLTKLSSDRQTTKIAY